MQRGAVVSSTDFPIIKTLSLTELYSSPSLTPIQSPSLSTQRITLIRTNYNEEIRNAVHSTAFFNVFH